MVLHGGREVEKQMFYVQKGKLKHVGYLAPAEIQDGANGAS